MGVRLQLLIYYNRMMPDQGRGLGHENQALVRGTLKKELYSSEKAELERKRKEMKSILDKQVEQRRRQKQMQKRHLQRLNQLEEEKIKEYFSKLESREKASSSGGLKKFSHNQISTWKAERKAKTKGRYTEKTIPVMSVLDNDSKGSNEIRRNLEPKIKGKAKSRNISYNSVGDLLLDLSPEEKLRKEPKAKNKSSNGRGKKRLFDENSEGIEESESKEVDAGLSENQELKQELRKNQEAISVLLGGMKSNKIMKKYQAKAEKILGGKAEIERQKAEPKSEELVEGMLPSLKLHHQSMMHDYIFGCARRASTKKI